MIVAGRGEKRGSSSSVSNFYCSGTCAFRIIDIIKLCLARSTVEQQGFLDSFLFFKETAFRQSIRVASEVSRAIIDDELWTAGFRLCCHVFWRSEEINPALPGAVAAAGQDEGGIYLGCNFRCSEI